MRRKNTAAPTNDEPGAAMEQTPIFSDPPCAKTPQRGSFTKADTALCKGVACILLLVHHLFYRESSLESCKTVLDALTGGTRGIEFVSYLSHVSKVCVALFLVLSGYGLAVSWRQKEAAQEGRGALLLPCAKFSFSHLLRLMCRFWLIFLLFVPFGKLFGRDPAVLFASSTPLKMWIKIALNFSGMSNLIFGSSQYTFNGTWWYMSVAILCYLLFPLFYAIGGKRPWRLLLPMALCVPLMFVPYFKNVAFWIIPFLLGMLAAGVGAFDIAVRWLNKYKWQGIIASAAAVVLLTIVRGRHRYYLDPLLSLAIIAFCVAALSRLPALSRALQFIGQHSANIFLFHSFLCAYYFGYIIYSPRYPLLILLFLLTLCLLISMGIEFCIRRGQALMRRIKIA